MITISTSGSFSSTEAYLKNSRKKTGEILAALHKGGAQGVDALKRATPLRTGLVLTSWDYIVSVKDDVYTLTWTNSDIEGGYFPVAVMLHYGHGTGTGGYVQGIDYINPTMRPIFDQITEEVLRVVSSG